MKIEDHKKAKTRHKGTDVKIQYDLKRDHERIALEIVGLKTRRAAAARAAPAPAKRPRRMAAE